MSRAIAYVTNEHPFYLDMLLNSIEMLVRHTPEPPPIFVFVIRADKALTIRRGGSFNDPKDAARSSFYLLKNLQDRYGYQVIERPPITKVRGEEHFFHINRMYLRHLNYDSLLYLDADTFIFQDINLLFERNQGHQFVAAPGEWVLGREFPSEVFPRLNVPFSSGVMLFNGGCHRDWVDCLPENCRRLREREHPVSDWLYEQHHDCLLREEFSASVWVEDGNIDFGYFSPEDVTLVRFPSDFDKLGKQVVFHSYTPNWKECRNRLLDKKGRRIIPMYLGKKNA